MFIILYEGELFSSKQDLHFVYWCLKVIIHSHKQTKIKMVVSYMDVVDFSCMKMAWKLMFFFVIDLHVGDCLICLVFELFRFKLGISLLFIGCSLNILNSLGLFWFWIKMGWLSRPPDSRRFRARSWLTDCQTKRKFLIF